MKRWWLGVLMAAVAVVSYVPDDAYAKRLGGGRPAGMQRQMPAQNQPTQATPSPATPNGMQQAPAQAPMAGAAGAAANAGKRSWMGPLAGLAAGIGLAALFSHFGMGEGLANVVMMVLMAGAAFFAIRWIMGRMGNKAASNGLRPSYAGAATGSGLSSSPVQNREAATLPMQRTDYSTPQTPTSPASNNGFVSAAQSFSASPAAASVSLPIGFDQAGFERTAKMIFIRLQAANDAGNLNDLRQFTTPEMFAAIRLDLQERGTQSQQTDVEELHAQVLHADQEAERLVVSVRFHGRIKEEAHRGAEPFDEIWHLVRQQGQDAWLIAGIQPSQPN